jgi:methylmalonyl-CoA/ethylmalonyl-CoA epimerase
MKIANVLQVCVVVRDLKKAMDRYHSLFGIGPFSVYTVDTEQLPGITYRAMPGNYRIQVAMARIGTGILELMEHQRGQTIYKEFLEQHGEGIQHIGFLVDGDYENALKELADSGFAHSQGGPIAGKNRDGRFDYFESQKALGAIVELLDMPEDPVDPTYVYPPPQ